MEHTVPPSSLILDKKEKEAVQMIKDHIVVAMGIEDPRFDEAYLYRFYVLGKKNVPKVGVWFSLFSIASLEYVLGEALIILGDQSLGKFLDMEKGKRHR